MYTVSENENPEKNHKLPNYVISEAAEFESAFLFNPYEKQERLA